MLLKQPTRAEIDALTPGALLQELCWWGIAPSRYINMTERLTWVLKPHAVNDFTQQCAEPVTGCLDLATSQRALFAIQTREWVKNLPKEKVLALLAEHGVALPPTGMGHASSNRRELQLELSRFLIHGDWRRRQWGTDNTDF